MPGLKCGECNNLVSHFYDKTYFKCQIYGESASEATDWAKRWEACGCFNKDYDGPVKIKFFVKHSERPKERIEIDGQERMELDG